MTDRANTQPRIQGMHEANRLLASRAAERRQHELDRGREASVVEALRNAERVEPVDGTHTSVLLRLLCLPGMVRRDGSNAPRSWTVLRSPRGALVAREVRANPTSAAVRTARPERGRETFVPGSALFLRTAPLPGGPFDALLQEAAHTHIPLAIPSRSGCDGTTYELMLGDTFASHQLRWWTSSPREWAPAVFWAGKLQTLLEKSLERCTWGNTQPC